MDEIIVSGYCRVLDGNRILCLEVENGEFETDCLYPNCEFAGSCALIQTAVEKVRK